MALLDTIQSDLKTAMKAGDALTVGVLRMIGAAIKNKSIEKRGKGESEVLTEEEVVAMLQREAKKRKEAIEAFEKGGRQDLADQEKAELPIIEKYLPEQLSADNVRAAVQKIMSGIQDKSNFGLVMKAVMQELKGKADAKLISQIIRSAESNQNHH
ncbi:MAG: GatB/YqeY domain-containing protein [bacterium]|nr:GatB/YqeY domain-containing protein [bacterium]